MTTINSEMRIAADGEPEIWANLGDILDWLDSLQRRPTIGSREDVATEIRQMLFAHVESAEHVTKK